MSTFVLSVVTTFSLVAAVGLAGFGLILAAAYTFDRCVGSALSGELPTLVTTRPHPLPKLKRESTWPSRRGLLNPHPTV